MSHLRRFTNRRELPPQRIECYINPVAYTIAKSKKRNGLDSMTRDGDFDE